MALLVALLLTSAFAFFQLDGDIKLPFAQNLQMDFQSSNLLLSCWVEKLAETTGLQLRLLQEGRAVLEVTGTRGALVAALLDEQGRRSDIEQELPAAQWSLLSMEFGRRGEDPAVTVCLVHNRKEAACSGVSTVFRVLLEKNQFSFEIRSQNVLRVADVQARPGKVDPFGSSIRELLAEVHASFSKQRVRLLRSRPESFASSRFWQLGGSSCFSLSAAEKLEGSGRVMKISSCDILHMNATCVSFEISTRDTGALRMCSSIASECAEIHSLQSSISFTFTYSRLPAGKVEFCGHFPDMPVSCTSKESGVVLTELEVEVYDQTLSYLQWDPCDHSPRQLQVGHIAAFSFEKYTTSSVQSFTFYNTHTNTHSITVELVVLTGFYVNLEMLSSTFCVYWGYSLSYTWISTTPSVIARGGFMGQYTVNVSTPPGYVGALYLLKVRIECSSSTTACFCASGLYPDPSTSECSACPSNSTECTTFGTSHCLPVTQGQNYAAGSFYCTPCISPEKLGDSASSICICKDGYYLDAAFKTCGQCSSYCKTCSSYSAAACLSCAPNAHLLSTAPSSCGCDIGYYGNTWDCQACDPLCLACSGGSPSSCTSCHANASLSGTSPKACKCNPGFTPYPNVAYCLACDLTCIECAGILNTECIICFANARLKGGSASDACVCNDGFFPNLTSASCQACDVSCFNCVGALPAQCTACKSHATLQLLSSSCLCDSRYFASPSPGNCTPCHITCKECAGGSELDCLECNDFAAGSSTFPSKCVCEDTTFPSPDSSSCKLCSETCRACSGSGPASCSSCKAAAHLSAAAPSQCECDAGFVPSPDASLCLPCSPVCDKCASAAECVSCKSHAELKDASCVCLKAFYGDPDASNCKACPEGCLVCIATGCSECNATYFRLDGACVKTCPKGYRASEDRECESVDLSHPVASLSVPSSDMLSVTFDRPMNCTLGAADIDIEVQTPNDVYAAVTWTDPQFVDLQTAEIHVSIPSTPRGSVVSLTFLHSDQVTDVDGAALAESTLTSPLPHIEVASEEPLLSSQAATTAAASVSGSMAAGALGSVFQGSPQSLILLASQMKLLSYVAMTELPLDEDFASSLAALGAGQVLPDPFSRLQAYLGNAEVEKPPHHVVNYGIDSLVLFANCTPFLGTVCTILMSYAVASLLSRIGLRSVRKYCLYLLPSFKWGVLLRLFLASYLDIGVLSLLQATAVQTSFGAIIPAISCVVAFLLVFLFAAAPFLLLSFLIKHSTSIRDRSNLEFNLRWGVLFLEFKAGARFSDTAFYFLFCARRLLLAFSLVLLPPGLFALFNTSFSFVVFFYLLLVCPFADRLSQAEALALEGPITLTFLLASLLLLDFSTEFKSGLNLVGLWTVRTAVWSNGGLSLLRSGLMLRCVFREFADRRKRVFSLF